MRAPAFFDDLESRKLVKQICSQHNIDAELLKDLCELIVEHSGKGRRPGLDADLTGILTRFIDRTSE